ncbi:MAG: hypothetical protein ACK5AZ_12725 [Bryobacteraceae bacterium]
MSMPQAFSILFGAVFTVAVCVAAGRLLLRRLNAPLDRSEVTPLAFVCGAPLVSTAIFALCAVQAVYSGVFLAFGAAVLARAYLAKARFSPPGKLPPLPRAPIIAVCVGLTPLALLTFFHAMAPEHSPDGSAYHLGLVARYYRDHGFPRITTSIYASLSQGVEMLFLYAYAFGRHSAAALVHFAFLPALAWLMFNFGRRFGFPWAGLAAGAIIFASPIFGVNAASAYNDVAVAAVVFAMFYLLNVWDATRSHALLVPTGLLAGSAYACKYTAFLAIPFAAGWVLWRLWRTPRAACRPLLTVAGLALAMMLPWVAKNTIVVGNPFSPFFNQWFPNPHVTIEFENQYRHHVRNYEGLESYRAILLGVTANGGALGGLVGPLFLLAPAGLLALRHPMGQRFWLAALVFAFPFALNVGTRFLLPSVPFIALALALALERWRVLLGVLVIAHAASAWPPFLKRYCDADAWRLNNFHWRPALRLESEEGFLNRMLPQFAIARMLDENVPPNGVILSFTPVSEAYTERAVIVPYQSASGSRLGDLQLMPLIPDAPPVQMTAFRFPRRTLRRLRVVQTNGGSPDLWAVSELRLWNGAVELEREPTWRLRARPFPWTVALAFDGRELTAWSSGEEIRPGMFIEVDLGASREADRVTVQAPLRYRDVRMRVEECGRDVCRPIDADVLRYETAAPLNLRRAATRELRQEGVTHLLIQEGDPFYRDYLDRPDRWGITLIGERNRAALFRIDET